ncbi:hypothetical protein ACQ29_gp263 [Escherichia phage PBECO4]|uniref:Uncharacterized protein n=1 Tax=Escherichia phage PBECO4 TaxID=1273738 RepID=L7TLG0_9CAUD|nr:hypothetical protein ACQ29_gp263 [Escherichia phage PBECO4]AGC34943.1 hypothetical protein [Escherichia phage PBECO4]EFJ0710443.1 hypothetical protein [Escherichia coli]MDI0694962.1 hypothetical protein [Escherichia coli]TZC62085.1 hypothetical protein E0J33_14060 [Escherichia coli]
MKNISTLIDAGTHVRRSMVATSSTKQVPSGYLVFVHDGKLLERSINFDVKNNCRFIIFKREQYKIDLPAKPISGAYSVQSLFERQPYTY